MRRDAGAVWRAATWAIGASIACAGCSRDPAGAAQDGADAVRAALEAGLDPDRPNGDGDALVHVAVRRRDPRMLGAVIARSARIDQRNDRGMTALGLTADELAGSDRTSRRNRDEGTVPGDELALACALELLQAHADPNAAQGPHGDRPLHLAAAAGSPELVEMLLDAGADPNGRSGRGETPLHAAAGADEYRGVAVTRLLVARGADARVTDVLGETPVHKAAERDSVELLLYYAGAGAAAGVDAGADAGVDAGVDLSAPNAWGATPLDRAVEGHRDRATEALYRLGAGVSWTRHFEPPLLAAARTDDVDRAQRLLAFGADPRRAFDGKSALEVARDSGSAGVLAVLIEAPARP